MGTRVNYTNGYVLARRPVRKPKRVPMEDTILLRLRRPDGGKRRQLDLYLRPDEAIAIILVLSSEVWTDMVKAVK